MPRRRPPTPDQQQSPRSEKATPWLVFAAMIICLAVLEATRVGLGHPAGWLDQAAGRGNAVPHFAGASSTSIDRDLVRIVPFERVATPAPREATASSQSNSGTAVAPASEPDVTGAAVQPTQPAPSILNTSAQVRIQPTRSPSRSEPLRVYVAGDSAAEPLGYTRPRVSTLHSPYAVVRVHGRVEVNVVEPSADQR